MKEHNGPRKARAALFSAGRMARAVGRILSSRAEVHVWARRPEATEAIRFELPSLVIARDPAEAAEGASLVFFAVPASAMLEVAELYGPGARGDHVVLHAS